MSLLDSFLFEPHPFEVWIAWRTDGVKGSGTAADPYNGSTAAAFDEVMRAVPPNSRVHLGPCPKDGSGNLIPFTTQGYYEGAGPTYGWRAKAGMKITGASIEITRLKLTGASNNQQYFLVGHEHSTGSPAVPNSIDHFEISDLTLDCDLAGQPSTPTHCPICFE